ncbi:hypothetical protein K9N68_33735 [Kovacikia minuta CCNUW1]|uniref:hypothetical protein n=1 Tax=Kovacikia minuta TaxID=2931930 RepID=UPI001CCF25AE|nr:hypothetical protein [Kovacikia minuta]UBF26405.1 hypothetical protein K9N68_33735 [Kovacikia minuta CCNUW1]
MSLNARLKRLEAIAASRQQQQDSQTIQQRIDSLKDVPYEQLLAEYEQFKNAPRDPEIAAKLDGMTIDDLIRHYFELCHNPN